MFGSELEAGLSADAFMVCYALCIRCGWLFGFDPERVSSTSVHVETRCTIRPDGSHVKAGDPDAVREPLCPPCAKLHRTIGDSPRPLAELFPHARLDLIDMAAALRIQAGAP
jgi:hypothetical protein